MTKIKHLLLAAVAAPMAIVAVAPAAHAQVSGIATADLVAAIYFSKAYVAANAQIRTTYATQITQLQAKQTERVALFNQLDKNKDENLDPAELAAQPALKTKLEQLTAEVNQLNLPLLRSKAFAVEMILQRYEEALKNVAVAKKINLILAPEVVAYPGTGVDVTQAITAELDRLVPTVPITAPANWNPSDEAFAVFQRLSQIEQAAAQRQAQQQAGQTPPPAGTTPPAAGTRPTTPPPGR